MNKFFHLVLTLHSRVYCLILQMGKLRLRKVGAGNMIKVS